MTLHRTARVGDMTLHVYGVDVTKLRDYSRELMNRMEQGFYVTKDDKATARAELSMSDRELLQIYLDTHHPEHAKL